jgi:hypothetical protein
VVSSACAMLPLSADQELRCSGKQCELKKHAKRISVCIAVNILKLLEMLSFA